MENCSFTVVKDQILYPSRLNCLKYNKLYDLICTGDEKGKISFFDIRVNKPVKLIKCDKGMKCEIKYIFY